MATLYDKVLSKYIQDDDTDVGFCEWLEKMTREEFLQMLSDCIGESDE